MVETGLSLDKYKIPIYNVILASRGLESLAQGNTEKTAWVWGVSDNNGEEGC